MYNYYYIVDTSYLIYYSAFSAFSEYVRDNDVPDYEMGPEFDPLLDPEYVYLFEKKFENFIHRPVQQLIPFIDNSKYIFCLDCKRKNIWRRNVFPEYKIQRDLKDTSKDKFDIGKSFEYAYKKIIPDFCSENESHSLMCEYAEGDDCIAVATKHILNQNKLNKVIIISCDKDMVQLCGPRITLITIDCTIREPKVEIEHTIKEKIKGEITPSDFLLWKIILGDKADGIPNIKSGVGNKKAFHLMMNKDELKKLLQEDINIAKAFKRNKELISLEYIPKEVENLIIEDLNSFLNSDVDVDVI